MLRRSQTTRLVQLRSFQSPCLRKIHPTVTAQLATRCELVHTAKSYQPLTLPSMNAGADYPSCPSPQVIISESSVTLMKDETLHATAPSSSALASGFHAPALP
jgi:hypothetical protein